MKEHAELASEIAAAFRDAHEDAIETRPEDTGCDPEDVNTEGGLVSVPCVTDVGLVLVMVPTGEQTPESLAGEFMQSGAAAACVGGDFVVAATTTPGAELVYEADLGCEFP